MKHTTPLFLAAALLFLSTGLAAQRGLPSEAFVYQGELTRAGLPADGLHDFLFRLYDGPTLLREETYFDIAVEDGVFSVRVDFLEAFRDPIDPVLEIAVREAGAGTFTLLAPRQDVLAAPRAHAALRVVDGRVDSLAIQNGTIQGEDVNASQVQRRVSDSCPPGSAIRSVASDGSVTCEGAGSGWQLGGNAGILPGQFLGTVDNVPLDLRANNQRALRLEWGFVAAGSPNLTAGSPANVISAGNEASVIAGGGLPAAPNTLDASYAAIGGGIANVVTGNYATIGGGSSNQASGSYASVPGGRVNRAAGDESVAMGRGAQADHDNSFVFNSGGSFTTTAPEQFLVNAPGGVGIGTESPSDALHVNAQPGQDGLRVQIDGTTALRVHDNGGVSVGVNSTPPAGGLLVNGPVRLQQPATRVLTLSAGNFLPCGRPSLEYRISGPTLEVLEDCDVSVYPEFVAAVPLPDGAVVQRMTARVVDSQAAGNVSVQLHRFEFAGPSGDLMADVSTSGSSPGVQQLVDSSVNFATVDTSIYSYMIEFQTSDSQATGSHSLVGVQIEYTVRDLLD